MSEIGAYIPAMLAKIFTNLWIKITGAFAFISYNFFFDSLHIEAMTALFFLIIADFVFGLIASYQAGIEIKSAKILRSAMKTAVYFIMISGAFLVETAGIGFLPLDETVIAFLAATELISLIENTANMGFATPKRLLNKLKNFTGEK